MKKLLIQLDSDKFASTFDCIVAHDAGADEILSYAGVTAEDVRSLVLSAVFTRGIPDLRTLAVWIGGSDVETGEQILAEAKRTFFGPFKISLMLDSNGCNTTASTAIAKLARQDSLQGKAAVVVGPGPVGLRAATLLAGEGCNVQLCSIPQDLLGKRYNPELAQRTLNSAKNAAEAFAKSDKTGAGSLKVDDLVNAGELEESINKAEIAIAAGPAGLQLFPHSLWAVKPGLKWLLDFNLTEPLGIEGIKPSDDFAEHEGKFVLGALAIGNPKMKVHKACVARLFDRNDLVLDTEGVYKIAKELV
ncbi:MAG TPA: methylene-tetrahydromethanopterin dehydrogenase N-terminal domain-containing protein [Anaerolineaceae bacterium]|nr:methylene-tetrahydromethanopterin dehydrogenase N-terminal domain-containing protein [Anaerolineaceae bacterium]